MDRFREIDEKEPEVYSTCHGCGEEIYCGEECYEIYGTVVHDKYDCVRKSVQARYFIAGDDDKYEALPTGR